MQRKKILSMTVAVMALVAPFAAHADNAKTAGWYVDGGGLGVFQSKSSSEVGGVKDKIQYDAGWGVTAGGGYAFENGLRAEAEVAYRRSAVDKVTGLRSTAKDGGSLTNVSFMGNVFYDLATGTMFTPYVGAGIGTSIVDANNIRTINDGSIHGDRMAFAYQGIAGVATAVSDHWSVTTDYRYFGTTDPEFKSGAAHAKTENASHNVMLGVRYSFGKPVAPAPRVAEPVVAPTPAPAKVAAPVVAPVPQSYMVFFDFDKSTLTPEAKRILASAAQDFKKGKFVRVVVTGHTDTMGTAKYNQKLSEKRAAAVRAEFTKLGVPAAEVTAQGAGKSGLLVPTADGVREAQNRRAEIVFDAK